MSPQTEVAGRIGGASGPSNDVDARKDYAQIAGWPSRLRLIVTAALLVSGIRSRR